MTEVAEGVAVVIAYMAEDKKCEWKPDNTSWKCKLDGSSESLRNNLWDHMGVPEPKRVTRAAEINARAWPSQAHHLIPWQQLKQHPVTQWLAQSPPVGAQQLYADNEYSVDYGTNGKFMPYASALDEWRTASTALKRELIQKVMRAAGIQLHQGPHSYKQYGVGEAGYKTRVAEYLQRIQDNSLKHAAACEDCKGKQQAGRLPPRRNVVRHMDKASERIEVDINTGRIFVSRAAADFVEAGGVVG